MEFWGLWLIQLSNDDSRRLIKRRFSLGNCLIFFCSSRSQHPCLHRLGTSVDKTNLILSLLTLQKQIKMLKKILILLSIIAACKSATHSAKSRCPEVTPIAKLDANKVIIFLQSFRSQNSIQRFYWTCHFKNTHFVSFHFIKQDKLVFFLVHWILVSSRSSAIQL